MAPPEPPPKSLNPILRPGDLVRLTARPEWGVGQVQTIIGEHITVNFEEAGKVAINAAVAVLERVEEQD